MNYMALLTKMSQLGHYETIRTLGTCIGNVVHERNPVNITSLTMLRTTKRSLREENIEFERSELIERRV